MIQSLSAPARRGLAFLLLAAVLLALAAAVAAPVYLLRHARAELDAVEARIDGLTRQVPTRLRLLDEDKQLTGGAQERLLLRGSTPGVAAAQLQGDLTALASALGAAVASVQIVDPEPAPPYTDVGLRLTMTADMSTLRDFLYTVENRDPVMLVRAFSLAIGDSAGETAAPGMEPLTATVEVHGYLAAPAAGAG